MTRVLIVEDDMAMQRALTIALSAHGYDVEGTGTGSSGVVRARAWHPDLVILDLGLPDMDGVDVARQLRAISATPIIVLSARDAEGVKVAALDAGADDYVTKPFGVSELLARMRASIRRTAPHEAGVVETPDFTVDLHARQVRRDGEPVHLTPTEWGIVELLARNVGRLVTYHELLHEVWGPEYHDETHYLRFYISQIRRKLEPDPSRPRYFQTEPGMGYRFVIRAETD